MQILGPRVAAAIDTVDIWQVSLHQPPEETVRLRGLLSPEELRKADAFRFEKDRRRYAVARGALRAILDERLGWAPEALRFEQGPHDKPCLTGGPGFNLSHCADLALIAVAADGRAVGVDVERVRSLQELASIGEGYFSAEEGAFLAAAGPGTRPRAFLALWTRREAAAKALGLDLQAALTAVRLPVYPCGGSVLLPELGGIAGPWSLQDLPLDAEHIGALCVQGKTFEVQLRFYSPALR
jgi:4'-phosphopantetheinyl transferase